MKASLPAPDPNEAKSILSPGFATSKTAASPRGELAEYVFPIIGFNSPTSICFIVKPSLVADSTGNLGFGWWNTAYWKSVGLASNSENRFLTAVST